MRVCAFDNAGEGKEREMVVSSDRGNIDRPRANACKRARETNCCCRSREEKKQCCMITDQRCAGRYVLSLSFPPLCVRVCVRVC